MEKKMQKTINIDLDGNALIIETHRWAKQSNGSALLTYRDNRILITTNMKEEAREGQDFFPLMVDFRENNYAGGKIPGGFFKREGKPSEREVLLSRLIDRPIRPLFPEGFFNETQVIALLLSADFSVDYDAMGITGASAALMSSTIPFDTPVAAVKVARRDGRFFINPGRDELNENEFEMVLLLAGTEDDIVMMEAEGDQFSEDLLKQGLVLGKEIIQKLCSAQRELINPDKITIEPDTRYDEVLAELERNCGDRLQDAIFIQDRVKRREEIAAIKDEVYAKIEDEELKPKYKRAFHQLEHDSFRQRLLEKRERNDGRALNEIRDLSVELDVLPRAHGSAVFTRGETQALAVVTLGSEDDAQRIDDIAASSDSFRHFMLHYNFPPFSVGEVSFLRGAGRREIGHGNLAWKGIRPVLPKYDEFPYTIRVVSDILESNGSSSMATVCGTSLALMQAGVPMRSAVSGIAMGLVKEKDRYVVLTDIAGFEDHFGDMDFKVAGTAKGINAVQLDIKIDGLSEEIIDATLNQAREARLHILEVMNSAIDHPAEELSEFAPVMVTMRIDTDKIRDLIGPGGKTIKELTATFGVKVNVDDDGKVTIAAPNNEVGSKVQERIKALTASPEIGMTYTGKITRIEDYGIFVDILGGASALVHISEISHRRIPSINDMKYEIGQEIEVKVIHIDRDGRVKASIRELQPEPEGGDREDGGSRPPRDRESQGRDNRSRDSRNRDSRGRDNRSRDNRGRDNRNRDRKN
ncbi:MAG TPA: polyribonucleotide nucleotidyltransferase [Candidatus Aminicenantes bacterium]|nr:polyribonucleotide nucleotidyltransferase [Candidatus Aminicenantes bacterium]